MSPVGGSMPSRIDRLTVSCKVTQPLAILKTFGSSFSLKRMCNMACSVHCLYIMVQSVFPIYV